MSDFDASDFVDDDFQAARKSQKPAPSNPFTPSTGEGANLPETGRAPTRTEVDSKVGEMQNKLAELKRVQQELERERANLEELRRRQLEFSTGRQEMVENLTRGVGLLEEAEFSARRDAEQMAKALVDLREALAKVQAVREETWTKDNLNVELTRALTAVENARMEWNGARLKFPILSGPTPDTQSEERSAATPIEAALLQQDYRQLLKLGLALTWPLALVAFAIFIMLLLQRIG